MTIQDNATKAAPRKLLALDGGGIRGTVTLEIPAELEQLLGAEPNLVHADYFDYVAGTNTEAIIATRLILNMRVANMRSLYLTSGPAMFNKANLFKRYLHNKYNDRQLAPNLLEGVG